MSTARLQCGPKDASNGYCTACGHNRGQIFNILAGNWNTRFCRRCLREVFKAAKASGFLNAHLPDGMQEDEDCPVQIQLNPDGTWNTLTI